MITDAELAAIRARLEAVPEPPWCWLFAGDKSNEIVIGLGLDADGNRLSGQIENLFDLVEPLMHGEKTMARRSFLG